jgi:hypothetical protein
MLGSTTAWSVRKARTHIKELGEDKVLKLRKRIPYSKKGNNLLSSVTSGRRPYSLISKASA